MSGNSFFNEQETASKIKSEIVAKYFWAWAKTMSNQTTKIAYIDLFAGRGRYLDGQKSTPILVLEQAIEDVSMRGRLLAIFNDKNDNNYFTLQREINNLPGIDSLRYAPVVYNYEVGTEIVKLFEKMKLIPTLMFVDPWGYRGLSLRLINSVLKDWGCEAIFFFNYNRINMGINNAQVQEHMEALFGVENIEVIQTKLKNLSPDEREVMIVEELALALKKLGGHYVLPFRFRDENGTRTKHHLIFVSKHILGYTIMKEIMSKYSSSVQGVPSFEYSPATERQPFLLQFNKPLDDLGEELLSKFQGNTLQVKEIIAEHHIDTPYIPKNYKEVLRKLLEQKKIKAGRKNNKPIRKGTLPDDVEISFPPFS